MQKTSQQSTILRSKLKIQRKILWNTMSGKIIIQRSNPWKQFLTFDHLTIITSRLNNEYDKPKMLVQSINQWSKGYIC